MTSNDPGSARAIALAHQILARDVRAIARAARWVDDARPEAGPLLRCLWPHTGGSWIVGVTGSPGAGKSTLCDQLISAYRRRSERVAVVAVDPTSPYSGGAILGDRVRMSRHASDDSVFIRSLATRGHMGGLSRSARDVARVFDAAGYNIVLIETVGVGQDEVEIASAAHSTLVVVAPGMGDGVQAMKAGILECADAFAVNKADREGADASARDLELMLSLNAPATLQAAFRADHGGTGAGRGLANRVATEGGEEAGWLPSVVKCIASRGDGVDGVVAALDQHRSWLGTRAGRARLRARLAQEVRASLREALVSAALLDLAPEIEAAVDAIETRSMDPYSATDRLVARFRARPG